MAFDRAGGRPQVGGTTGVRMDAGKSRNEPEMKSHRNPNQSFLRLALAAAFALPALFGAAADFQPADPELIPEGRRLLEYLQSIEGKGILAGKQSSGGGTGPFEVVLHVTGREPALRGTDIAGFHPEGSDIYHQVMRGQVDRIRYWWREKGGVVQTLYHWGNPMHPRGTAWKGRPAGSEAPDIGSMTTPGSVEYEAFHENLSYTADYLEELAEERVPLLFAPLHEIDGGWFWWTDAEHPEHTAALYRQVFDYLVNERGIHNLIWVFHAAHRCNAFERMVGQAPDLTLEDEIAHRKRFYPGDDYVDIAGLSTYGNARIGWNHGWEDARRKAHEMMAGIAPGKPLAVNEAPSSIHPLMARKQGLKWLWSRAWHNGPADWMRYTYNHPHMITLDALPLLHGGNVMPNVRIDWPVDGSLIGGGDVFVSGMAADRNGKLERVSLHVLSGPWMDWSERSHGQVMAVLEARGKLLGEARLGAGGRWTYTWENAPSGHHQLVALARDSDGAVAYSNGVRMTKGLDNLARGKPMQASSVSPWCEGLPAAVDDNLFSMWWADHREEDPQWLQVDLGSVRTVGAVSVLWWKAYATDYSVQVSTDGENWREVARIEGRQQQSGDSDLVRFDPVPARHVRLHFTRRAVTWQAYCIYDFGVYESLPGGE